MMARFDARKESFEEITVLGKAMLFTGIRIDRATVPKGLHLYGVRHDDEGKGKAVQIAKGILVNHWGSIISRDKLRLSKEGFLDIDPEKDWDYLLGNSLTIEEYCRKYPVIEKGYER